MAKKYNSTEGVWRTIGGRRVFIKTGQSLSDAMKESGKFKGIRKDVADNVKFKDVEEKSMKRKGVTSEEYQRAENREKELRNEYNNIAREKGRKSEEAYQKEEELYDARQKYESLMEKDGHLERKYSMPVEKDRRIEDGKEIHDVFRQMTDREMDAYAKKNPDSIKKMQEYIKDRDNALNKNGKEKEHINVYKRSDAEIDDAIITFNDFQKYEKFDMDRWNNATQSERDAMVKEPIKKYLNDSRLTKNEVADLIDVMENENYHTEARILREMYDEDFKSDRLRYVEENDKKMMKTYEKAKNMGMSNENATKVALNERAKESGNDYLPKASKVMTAGTSNRKEVSDNIQAHILEHYDNPVDFMEQMDAMDYYPTKWHAGEELAKGGSYLIYYDDQREFLNSLNINPKGKTFSDDKVFDMYNSLVGRESERLYNRLEKLYEKYKEEHKGSDVSLDDFRKWFK